MEEVARRRLHHQIFPWMKQVNERWQAPPPGVVRLDVDASVRDNQYAACGGVIRDENRDWIMGFQKLLGTHPIMIAEILAIKTGLEVCRDLKFTHVQVFSDLLEAVNILMRDSGTQHPFRDEIEATRQLLYENWNLSIQYADREAIECADCLAKKAHDVDGQTVLLPDIPSYCRSRILLDPHHVVEGSNVHM
ncbi:uncharacterized protein LOC114712503 [Neltuma alba]|uniref:uncharacterized protein LOC114712503 n=1 Tax=Neltuma alba TaxID=207710 RepID=UPI0010A5804C|nr:uncharacterized protein LOC114712503 [Prosopis alba]